MKLKINKACDLSSISVLPPQSRRLSGISNGSESSSIFGRSQTASQLRPQQSQLTLSQGVSSQHGLFSQFSQNSQDDILNNEKIGSQERESSMKRTSCLSLIDSAREENQMIASRTSNNMMRKWSSQDNKCQIEHRIGMIETSLSRLGLILDSVLGDIMQANKGTKEVALEMKDIRQKLNAYDDLLQLMEIFCSMKMDAQKQVTSSTNGSKALFRAMAVSCDPSPLEVQFPDTATRHLNTRQTTLLPKVEPGGWTSVKQERIPPKVGNQNKRSDQKKASPHQSECRIVIESDEEIDDGLSCLFQEKGTELDKYSAEELNQETARILRKARRRKRKYSNTIIIN